MPSFSQFCAVPWWVCSSRRAPSVVLTCRLASQAQAGGPAAPGEHRSGTLRSGARRRATAREFRVSEPAADVKSVTFKQRHGYNKLTWQPFDENAGPEA